MEKKKIIKINTNLLNKDKEEQNISLTVKDHLSLTEYVQLIQTIYELVFPGNSDGQFTYYLYIKDFIIKSQVILFYTNLKIQDVDDKQTSVLWELIATTDIYEKLVDIIGEETISNIEQGVDELIQYRISVSNTISKYDELLDNAINFMKSITELAEEADLSSLTEQINLLKKNVDGKHEE